MTLQEIFTSDMEIADLVALARRGLAWWLDELATLLPERLRERLSSRPRVWIEADGEGWRLRRNGQPAGPALAARVAGTRIGLLTPRQLVFVRRIPVPKMPAADVRRMLTLELDRFSPLDPALVQWDSEIVRTDDDAEQHVILGLIHRDDAERILAKAKSDGFSPSALSCLIDNDLAPPRFDFLPRMADTARSGGIRRWLWIGVATLLTANVALLVGRDVVEVSRMRDRVETQAMGVAAVARLRQRVEGEEARRREIVDRGLRSDPIRLIETLTSLLPASAWVQHFEWNGQRLRIAGFERDDYDLAAALRATGSFVNTRMLSAPPASGLTSTKPFDIAADAAMKSRR